LPIGENPFVFSVVAKIAFAAAEETNPALIKSVPLHSEIQNSSGRVQGKPHVYIINIKK